MTTPAPRVVCGPMCSNSVSTAGLFLALDRRPAQGLSPAWSGPPRSGPCMAPTGHRCQEGAWTTTGEGGAEARSLGADTSRSLLIHRT